MVVGAIFGIVSVVGNMPMVVLAVASSLAGAVSVVAGVMLLVGSLNSADLADGSFSSAVDASWGWYVLLLVLALIGFVAQTRQRVAVRRSINEAWYAQSRSRLIRLDATGPRSRSTAVTPRRRVGVGTDGLCVRR